MNVRVPGIVAITTLVAGVLVLMQSNPPRETAGVRPEPAGATRLEPRAPVTVRQAARMDVSAPLPELRALAVGAATAAARDAAPDAAPDCGRAGTGCGVSPRAPEADADERAAALPVAPDVDPRSAAVEQTSQGNRPPAVLLESFDGHGFGTRGPHGPGGGNNPSDNSLAVGPNHIVETVNSRIAVYSKKGAVYDTSGAVLFGPIGTNVVFSGFGGECERAPNGDAVVRYDQLADRWLVVMPLFRRAQTGPGEAPGPYGMCYALSIGANPLGPYHRYYFERDLFPDYPRPAVWPDGYYVPTSTGDDVIERHACVVDRTRMLQGGPATEQCVIIHDVNFLNNADIDGQGLPPAGAPNIMLASGGTQLREVFHDDGIYAWTFHVDWENPENTEVAGPTKIAVAPYDYLCNGQLSRCVPQPGTENRIDSQGDKIMQRLVYRNIDGRESIVAVHSVATAAGGGGVRWYELRLDEKRDPYLHQQGTYAPDEFYRWMASPAMDRQGNIGIGYSFGGAPHYPGQRFAGRLAGDPPGRLTLHETVLVHGQNSQTNTLRWQDYTQTAMDPVDDCTIWYVGDYLKAGAPSYTTRIGAFRLPGCLRGTLSGTAFYDRNRNGVREPNEPGLPGWPIRYAGVRREQEREAPPSGTLTTDERGDYRASLPADPAYFDPTYTVSARAPEHPAWTRSGHGVAYSTAGTVPMADHAYTVRLRDRDDVTHLSFGYACTAPNRGGAATKYWLGRSGRKVLSANDEQPTPGAPGGRRGAPAGWRGIVNARHHLVNADGSRLEVAGTFDQAYDRFARWLRGGGKADAPYRASVRLATTALNVAYGRQAGNATVEDPVAGDWTPVSTLLTRVSTLIAAGANASAPDAARGDLEKYTTVLERLNSNEASVTPPAPGDCPAAFQRTGP